MLDSIFLNICTCLTLSFVDLTICGGKMGTILPRRTSGAQKAQLPEKDFTQVRKTKYHYRCNLLFSSRKNRRGICTLHRPFVDYSDWHFKQSLGKQTVYSLSECILAGFIGTSALESTVASTLPHFSRRTYHCDQRKEFSARRGLKQVLIEIFGLRCATQCDFRFYTFLVLIVTCHTALLRLDVYWAPPLADFSRLNCSHGLFKPSARKPKRRFIYACVIYTLTQAGCC